jgi:hypothetical protein
MFRPFGPFGPRPRTCHTPSPALAARWARPVGATVCLRAPLGSRCRVGPACQALRSCVPPSSLQPRPAPAVPMSVRIVPTITSRGITPPPPMVISFPWSPHSTTFPSQFLSLRSLCLVEQRCRPRNCRASGPPPPSPMHLPRSEHCRPSVEPLGRAPPRVRTTNPLSPLSLPRPFSPPFSVVAGMRLGAVPCQRGELPEQSRRPTRPRPSSFTDSGHGAPRRARAGGGRRS